MMARALFMKTLTGASVLVSGLVSTVKLKLTRATAILARMEARVEVQMVHINVNAHQDGPGGNVQMKLHRVTVIRVRMAASVLQEAKHTNVSVQRNGRELTAMKSSVRAKITHVVMVQLAKKMVFPTLVSVLRDGLAVCVRLVNVKRVRAQTVALAFRLVPDISVLVRLAGLDLNVL